MNVTVVTNIHNWKELTIQKWMNVTVVTIIHNWKELNKIITTPQENHSIYNVIFASQNNYLLLLISAVPCRFSLPVVCNCTRPFLLSSDEAQVWVGWGLGVSAAVWG